MFTPYPLYARLLGALAAVALLAIAAVGIFSERNDPVEVAASPAETVIIESAPVAPLASITIEPDSSGPNLDPFTGEVVLAAYTELSPAEWVEGTLAGLRPEPEAAPSVSAAAPTSAPVEAQAPVASAAAQTEAAAATPTPASAVQAAPFDGVVVAEDVGPAADAEPEATAVAPVAPFSGTDTGGWAALRNCESGGNYQINSGNGFYGAYQFTIGTWNAVAAVIDPTYVGVRPDLAPPAAQDRMAYGLRYEIAWGGWQHWPICGRHIA